jgi:hypothetical protein
MLHAWSFLPESRIRNSIPLPTNLFTRARSGPQISALHICFQSTPNQSLNGGWSVHWYGNKRTDQSQPQNTSMQKFPLCFTSPPPRQVPTYSVSFYNRWLMVTWSDLPVSHCRIPHCRHSLFSNYSRAHPVNILSCCQNKETRKKLRGLSPRANYTDLAIAACRRR